VAQVLLTRADMEDLRRYMNIRRTLDRLLRWEVLPIINENATTTVDELRMGDNDELSAVVARKMRADLLVMLTSADGLMTGDPRSDAGAELVRVVKSIDAAAVERVQVAPSKSGRGGIQGKLRAAHLAIEGGVTTVVANGRTSGALARIVAGAADVGTLFLARSGPRPNPIRNFLMTEKTGTDCRIVVNDGAAAALRAKGASLLPVGIERVEGAFEAGDIVMIADGAGRLIGKGISTYSQAELKVLAGHRTERISELIGHDEGPTAVHRDCLVLL
jgi:glutamate 5-kinase